MIWVLTIPSTGTHFVRDELLEGVECRSAHIYQHDIEAWSARLMSDDPIIVPLRHPLEVAKSWKRRPHRQLPVEVLPYWWKLLIGFVDPWDPCYLPLDVPARDVWLDRLNNRLGLSLRTDWVWKHKLSQPVELGAREHLVVDRLMENHEPFFSRFGYT